MKYNITSGKKLLMARHGLSRYQLRRLIKKGAISLETLEGFTEAVLYFDKVVREQGNTQVSLISRAVLLSWAKKEGIYRKVLRRTGGYDMYFLYDSHPHYSIREVYDSLVGVVGEDVLNTLSKKT